MSVRIRLEAVDVDDLDAHEAVLRRVLTIPGCASSDYPNRRTGRGGQPARRRYLDSTGVQPTEPTDPGRSPLAAAEDARRRRDLGGEIGALMAGARDLAAQPWAPLRPGDVVLCWLAGIGYGQTYLATTEIGYDGHADLREISTTEATDDANEPGESDESEFLLRYDIPDGQWLLARGPVLLDWLNDVHPSAVTTAQTWAATRIGLVDGVAAVAGWRPVADGYAPVQAGGHGLTDPPLESFHDLWLEAGPGALAVIRAGVVVHGTPRGGTR